MRDLEDVLLYGSGKPYFQEVEEVRPFLETIDAKLLTQLSKKIEGGHSITIPGMAHVVRTFQELCKSCENSCTCYDRKANDNEPWQWSKEAAPSTTQEEYAVFLRTVSAEVVFRLRLLCLVRSQIVHAVHVIRVFQEERTKEYA